MARDFPPGQFPSLRLAAWISLIAVIETGFLGLSPLNHVWVNSFVLWSLQLAPVLHVLSGGGELFDVSLCLRPFLYRSCGRFCHRFSPLFAFTVRSASPKVMGKRGNVASFSGQGDWKKYHLRPWVPVTEQEMDGIQYQSQATFEGRELPSSMLYNAALHIDESDLLSEVQHIEQEQVGQRHIRVWEKKEGGRGVF